MESHFLAEQFRLTKAFGFPNPSHTTHSIAFEHNCTQPESEASIAEPATSLSSETTSTMAMFGCPTISISFQDCTRNDLRRPEIQNFPGGACPQTPLKAALRALFDAAPASQPDAIGCAQPDQPGIASYGPVLVLFWLIITTTNPLIVSH